MVSSFSQKAIFSSRNLPFWLISQLHWCPDIWSGQRWLMSSSWYDADAAWSRFSAVRPCSQGLTSTFSSFGDRAWPTHSFCVWSSWFGYREDPDGGLRRSSWSNCSCVWCLRNWTSCRTHPHSIRTIFHRSWPFWTPRYRIPSLNPSWSYYPRSLYDVI